MVKFPKVIFLLLFIFSITLTAQNNPPTNLQGTILEKTVINLTWVDNSLTETKFIIETSIGTTDKWSVADTLHANSTSYSFTNVVDGTVYHFRVYALFDSVKSDYSNVISIEIPLNEPTNLKSVNVSPTQIDLIWEDNSKSEIGYKVERKVGEMGLWQLAANQPPNSTTFSDYLVADGTTYFYRLSAFNTDTTSQFSNEIKVIIPISSPDALNFKVISNNKIVLSWADNSKSETALVVQQKIGNIGLYNSVAELPPNTFNFTVDNLEADSTYYFRVFCYNSLDTSDFTKEVKYTVPSEIKEVVETAPSPFTFNMNLDIGLNFSARSTHQIEKENLEWLLGTHFFLSYMGDDFQFDTDLFIQYGQLVAKNVLPQKTQDAIIWNIMPSIKVMSSPTVRLFLQTKAETQIAKGFVDDQETKFADPMFITYTLFLGNKNQIITLADDLKFKVVYGIGYSFQQIIKKNFQLLSEIQSSAQVDYIDGPSAVFNLLFTKTFGEIVNTSLSLNSILVAKKNFFKDTDNSRFSSLLVASVGIDLFSIKYTNRLVYDSDISVKRNLDQSLVLTFQLSL